MSNSELEKRPETASPTHNATPQNESANGLGDRLLASHGPAAATLYLDRQPGATPAAASPAVDQALGQAGGGAAHDSGARIHTGSTAEAAAGALGARAFTAGSDMYFGAGQYQPGTPSGDTLLRHELTHVEQSRGQPAPAPGNYRVSDPGDGAEVAARGRAAGDASPAGAGSAATIYRDPLPGAGSPAPAPGATPASPPPPGTAPAPGSTPAGPAAADPWKAYVEAVTKYNKADALAKWAALPTPDKGKLKTDSDIQMKTMWTFNKESAPILAQGGVDWSSMASVFTVFLQPDFDHWMIPLKTNNIFNSFVAAAPRNASMSAGDAKKMGSWINQGSDADARLLFEKVFTKVDDTWSTYTPWTVVTAPWTKDTIAQLYNRITGFGIPIAHALTIKGYYLVSQVTKPGDKAGDPPVTTVMGGAIYYGAPWFEVWFTPNQARQSAGLDGANGSGTATVGGGTKGGGQGSLGHDGVGGNNAQSQTAATNPLDHFTNAVLHEIGHGVGDRVQGNSWAATKFAKAATPEDWGKQLWDSSTDLPPNMCVEGHLDVTAVELRTYLLDKIAGKATPTLPGSYDAKTVEKYIADKKSTQELYQAWNTCKVDGERYRNPWSHAGKRYAYLSRWGNSFATYPEDMWTERVSLYSLSSPNEYFAEQYTEYYRPVITGGAKGSTMKTPAAKAFLDQIDQRGFDPATNTATGTVASGGASANSGAGGPSAVGGGASGGAVAAPQIPRAIPWP